MSEICCRVSSFDRIVRVDDDGDGVPRDHKLDRLDCRLAGIASISSALMAREALAISTVPFARAVMPVPEPPPVTEMLHLGVQCSGIFRPRPAPG